MLLHLHQKCEVVKKILDKKTYENADLEDKLIQAEERLNVQDAEIEILKKFITFLPNTCKKANKFCVINEFINNNSYLDLTRTHLVKLLCSYLCVSVSGFYKYLKSNKIQSAKKIEDISIEEFIFNEQTRLFRKSNSKFKKIGYRRMTMLINKSNIFNNPINHKRIYRIMKMNSMLSQYRQKNPYKVIPSVTSEHKSCDNLVDTNFDSPYAYNVLCTEITYLICDGMKAYLSAIKDAATGRIIAYELSESLKIDFVLDTVRQLDKDLLNDETKMQTDRGSHYTSPQFAKSLNKFEITHSMSRKGKCTDNAPIESFFGHFKCEVALKNVKI